MKMLDQFIKAQQPRIEALRGKKKALSFPSPLSVRGTSFFSALVNKGKGAVIAEYKRASPSKGVINLGVSPKEIAQLYASNGAAAISVLTEEKFFQGSLEFLAPIASFGVPLLRKDFLIDPIQIEESATYPVSAVLLIVRILDDATFDSMVCKAKELGIETVIEIFNSTDLERVRASSQRTGIPSQIIQVNTRDLDTLDMDESVLSQLINKKQTNELWIAASGVSSREDIDSRVTLGYDAVLVGTGIMQSEDPAKALHFLTKKN